MKKHLIIIPSILLLTFSFSTNKLPIAKGYINDFEKIYTESEIKSLDSLVTNFEKSTSIEISIVTLDTNYTSKENFDDYTLKLANHWGVGKIDKDNGILIGVSKSLRKIRIQNGYGIEKVLSDSATKVIIDSTFIPQFKKGNFFKGTFNGALKLMEAVK